MQRAHIIASAPHCLARCKIRIKCVSVLYILSGAVYMREETYAKRHMCEPLFFFLFMMLGIGIEQRGMEAGRGGGY